MILDRVENVSLYHSLHPRLARAFEAIAATNWEAVPAGRHKIDGDCIFALVNEYTTQPLEKIPFESHQRYTDIQLMIRGLEQISVAPVTGLEVTQPYSVERDIAFYRGSGDFITLSPSTFAVFFPHDGHQPGIAVNQPETVRKVVLKVELSA